MIAVRSTCDVTHSLDKANQNLRIISVSEKGNARPSDREALYLIMYNKNVVNRSNMAINSEVKDAR